MDGISGLAVGIRSARKRVGLTQDDLALLTETSGWTIQAIETGTGNPSLKSVVEAANVLGLRLAVTR